MASESASNGKPEWMPPAKVEELFCSLTGNKFATINSPVAGARSEKELPEGSASVQLYSLFTPNGQKVGILFEELGLDYDAHVIDISNEEQFTSGFVHVNPNSKIPACVDKDGPEGECVRLFESGSIMQYFAEKHRQFIPADPVQRQECLNWLYWQMAGLGPSCGQFAHFFRYAPAEQVEARNYGVARYGMEVKRLCSVLDQRLSSCVYLAGDEYTIADMAVYPWVRSLLSFQHASGVTAADMLSLGTYEHIARWVEVLSQRGAVQRGLQVCRADGVAKPWLQLQSAESEQMKDEKEVKTEENSMEKIEEKASKADSV